MIVTHADLVACKFCNRGARQFFERHGLDWQSFMQHGLDAAEVEHIDDAMMRQVIEQSRRRQQGEA